MRNYIVASWNDADQYDYSGEMLGGSRHQGRSQKIHFNPDGSACVASYGDEPKTTEISIKDRILPQFKRLQTLRTQMLDLEKEYKTTDMTCAEYSILRDVIVCKIERAEVLYKKAISIRPIRPESEEDSTLSYAESFDNSSDNTQEGNDESEPCGVRFIDELSNDNSLKSFLQNTCKAVRKVIQFSHKAKAYWQELKEV